MRPLTVAAEVAYHAWLIPAIATPWWSRHRGLRRWLRVTCPLLPPALVVLELTDPPRGAFATLFTGAAVTMLLIWWRWTHRRFCRDDHSRRLRDAANGLVHRVGNRLRVAPVGGAR